MKNSVLGLAFAIALSPQQAARAADPLRAPSSPADGPAASDDDPSSGRRADQTIRFARAPFKVYLDPDFDVEATASSGLPVRFTASGDCSVSGSTVSLLSAGKCWVTAHQEGDSRFAPASDVDLRFPIAKADQRISFPPPPLKTYLDPDFDLNATASSDLPVVLIASGDCSVSVAYLHILAAGSCSITAHQPGDSNFTAARIVDQQFAIAKADQTITFAGLPDYVYGSIAFQLLVTATSGLPVSLAAGGSCQVSGSTLYITATGQCTVIAQQPGSSNFNPAPSVTQTAATQVD